jgi:thiamine biosynthesis lipoprotein
VPGKSLTYDRVRLESLTYQGVRLESLTYDRQNSAVPLRIVYQTAHDELALQGWDFGTERIMLPDGLYASSRYFGVIMSAINSAVWLAALLQISAGQGPSRDAKAGLRRFEFQETHMASPFNIILYSADESTASHASRQAYERIAKLNAILSDYEPDSELSRLCQTAGGPAVKVSSDLFKVLTLSKEIWERSGGAFDVTIAPVGRLWRRARRDHKLPDRDRLEQARLLVGSDKMVLDPTARTVRLLKSGMKLDAGGIAKGYAAQAALDVLKTAGIKQALVAAAGDIVVGAPPPGERGWKVAIAPLEHSQTEPLRTLVLSNVAVSTAGDTERFVIIDGHRYSHIVNPATGWAIEDRATVTVVAADGATADALETTVYVMGPERGLKLVDETPGASAIFFRLTKGGIKSFESSRFKQVPSIPVTESAKP